MLGRLIESSRYLAAITILLTLLAAIALYIAATMSFVTIVVDAFRNGPWLPKVAKETAIGFLNMCRDRRRNRCVRMGDRSRQKTG